MPFAGSEEFNLDLKSRKYLSCESNVLKLRGSEVTAAYLTRNGFDKPILVPNKDGLGLRVPDTSFTIPDVADFVGLDHEVEVINVREQSDEYMAMGTFLSHFFAPMRSNLLNILSLEFSKTRLSALVNPPRLVRDLSLVEKYWPAEEDIEQADEEAIWSRPSVQKYCLISMSDSYTDFHIDFGGSSVWYHILWGEKVFYLVPATPANLVAYRRWYSLANHHEVFFPDFLQRYLSSRSTEDSQLSALPPVYRLRVRTGQTVFLPAGWIHAVYTPVDSLVFGGNFLHELGIVQQISIYRMELKLHTDPKFMFPHFEKLHWFVAEALLGKFKNFLLTKTTAPMHYIEGGQCLARTLDKWLERRKQLPASDRVFYLPDRQHMELPYPDLIRQLKLVLDRMGFPVKDEPKTPEKRIRPSPTRYQRAPLKSPSPSKRVSTKKRKHRESLDSLEKDLVAADADDTKSEDEEEDPLPIQEEEEELPDLKHATLIGEHYYFPVGADSDDDSPRKNKRRRGGVGRGKGRFSKTATPSQTRPGNDTWKPSTKEEKAAVSNSMPGTSKNAIVKPIKGIKSKKSDQITPQQRLAKKLGISPFRR